MNQRANLGELTTKLGGLEGRGPEMGVLNMVSENSEQGVVEPESLVLQLFQQKKQKEVLRALEFYGLG